MLDNSGYSSPTTEELHALIKLCVCQPSKRFVNFDR